MPIKQRVGFLMGLCFVVGLSLQVLPKIDPYSGRVYSMTLDASSRFRPMLGEAKPVLGEAKPVLGEASCEPFRKGVNSLAMRWVLYQEAVAITSEKPLFGTGAARFGQHSCSGPLGFPHSTVLQGFSELGLAGGGLLVALLAVAAGTFGRAARFAQGCQEWSGRVFVLALFGAFLLADQVYGNYFMASGTWLLLGAAASLRAEQKAEASHA